MCVLTKATFKLGADAHDLMDETVCPENLRGGILRALEEMGMAFESGVLELASVVMEKLVTSPPSQWEAIVSEFSETIFWNVKEQYEDTLNQLHYEDMQDALAAEQEPCEERTMDLGTLFG